MMGCTFSRRDQTPVQNINQSIFGSRVGNPIMVLDGNVGFAYHLIGREDFVALVLNPCTKRFEAMLEIPERVCPQSTSPRPRCQSRRAGS